MKTMERRRRFGAALMAVGAVLAIASVGPLSWGLGMVAGVVAIVSGFELWTDRRPETVRSKRRW